MDPLTVTALSGLLTTLLGSAAGEAGKSAWNSLTATTQRLLGREAPATTALEAAAGGSPAAIEVAAGRMVDAAAHDPEFARTLGQWHEKTTGDIQIAGAGGVNNSVSGDAQVGRLIQAHTVGDITFN
ncbi:hypothetical protein GCM10022223_41640 [Kineosporia mesophila]|uniref:Uncharacterized protein n=1 Tax=Kineosporia mesophila TaxID=566012 RepID=A0ABP6ZW62_9ACTN|nr:hypothetical protein [Kineosporia mesophila]MCD5348779.1 hypothetical protein [Kineosporia mesophila]